MRKKLLVILLVIALASAAAYTVFATLDRSAAPGQNNTNTTQTPGTENQPTTAGLDKTQYSLDDPGSIWVVANKQRPLNPENYQPSDLVVPNVRLRVPGHETMKMRAEAAKALEDMFAAASNDGLELMLSSAFRSYGYQVNLYNSYVNSSGREAADRESARPGHSEHQTGLAADVRPTNGQCELEQCFGDMAEGKWVAANAHTYGFIVRYSPTNASEAGYTYEPWHIRYVGKALAAEYVRVQATSLETFFGLPAAPDYN